MVLGTWMLLVGCLLVIGFILDDPKPQKRRAKKVTPDESTPRKKAVVYSETRKEFKED